MKEKRGKKTIRRKTLNGRIGRERRERGKRIKEEEIRQKEGRISIKPNESE